MPVVPRAQRQVGTAPLPGARVSPGAPAAAFGVPASVDLSGLQRSAERVYEQERQKANQAALLDADSQAWELEKGLFHDPKTGALQSRGKNAIDATDKAVTDYEKGIGEIGTKLSSDEQRLAFQARAQARRIALDGRLQEHVANETQRYVDEQFDTAIRSRIDEALSTFQDGANVDRLVLEQKAIVREYGKNHGWAPEVTDAKTAAAVSQTRAGVISRMLTAGDDRTATAYYAKYKADITGSDAERIDKALEIGSTEGTALRTVDSIWNTLGPKSANDPVKVATMEDAIREQHADDPKVIKAAVAELRSRASAFNAQQNELTASNKAGVLGAFNQGASLAELVRMPQYRALSGTDQEQVKSYVVGQSRQLSEYAEAERTKKGFAAYWFYSRPEKLSTMSENELLSLEPILGQALTGRLVEQKRTFGKSSDRVLSATIDDDLFKTIAQDAGFKAYDPKLSADDKATLGHLKNTVEDAIARAQERTGKPLNREEKQQVMQTIIDQKVMVDRFARGDTSATIAAMTKDERGRAYVPLEQIPTNNVSEAVNWLRSVGAIDSQTTDAEATKTFQRRIERAVAAQQMGQSRAQVEAILRGAQ